MKQTKVSEQFARVDQMIRADKSLVSDGCKALVLQDFAKLFEEYFELSSPPEMDIEADGGAYKVCVRFQADRIKKFNVLK
jgi:hypothetical protein